MADYFQHLTHFPALSSSYLTIAQNRKYQRPDEHQTFTKLTISPTDRNFEFTTGKFMQDLRKQFPTTLNPIFVKTGPMSLYDWHVDKGGVTTGINILLSSEVDSYTLFKDPTDIVNQYKLTRCNYTPLVPTVFDSSVPHCVMNLGNEDRYLMRIPVKFTSYAELKNYLLDYQFTSYDC